MHRPLHTSLVGEAVLGRDSEPNVAGAGFQCACQASGRRSGWERWGPDVRVLRSDPLIPGSSGEPSGANG